MSRISALVIFEKYNESLMLACGDNGVTDTKNSLPLTQSFKIVLNALHAVVFPSFHLK